MSPYANKDDPRLKDRYEHKRIWQRHDDGLIHCGDQNPGCTYTHKRAASVGRHAMIHQKGKPYARNFKDDVKKRDAKRLEQRRAYAREYHHRKKANRLTTNPVGRPHKETNHDVSSTDSHSQDHDKAVYFLAGGFIKDIQSAARTLRCTEGELAAEILSILRAAALR